jgi:hypothetical protein
MREKRGGANAEKPGSAIMIIQILANCGAEE